MGREYTGNEPTGIETATFEIESYMKKNECSIDEALTALRVTWAKDVEFIDFLEAAATYLKSK
jgi:hypothetical protein